MSERLQIVVEQLRRRNKPDATHVLCREAADVIERLQREVDRARECGTSWTAKALTAEVERDEAREAAMELWRKFERTRTCTGLEALEKYPWLDPDHDKWEEAEQRRMDQVMNEGPQDA